MGMADAAGDAAKAPNKDAATRPILRFMMCLPPLTQYRISKFVLIKLWRNQNAMLMNKSSASAPQA
jgi:hypothetical protein